MLVRLRKPKALSSSLKDEKKTFLEIVNSVQLILAHQSRTNQPTINLDRKQSDNIPSIARLIPASPFPGSRSSISATISIGTPTLRSSRSIPIPRTRKARRSPTRTTTIDPRRSPRSRSPRSSSRKPTRSHWTSSSHQTSLLTSPGSHGSSLQRTFATGSSAVSTISTRLTTTTTGGFEG